MTSEDFVKKYRGEIDAAIRRRYGAQELKISDEERELWVLNDEALYTWALAAGMEE